MRKRKVLQAIKYSSLNSFKYQSTHFWFHSIKEKSNEKITSTRQVWKGGIEKWLAADVSNLKLNPNTNILTAHLIESKIYFHVSTIRIVDRLTFVLNGFPSITLITNLFVLIGMYGASNQIWEKLLTTTTRN